MTERTYANHRTTCVAKIWLGPVGTSSLHFAGKLCLATALIHKATQRLRDRVHLAQFSSEKECVYDTWRLERCPQLLEHLNLI